jgi:hypothetical protein
MCNACYRVVSLLVVLTRHFDSDRTYSATASGRQPSEPIPPVGLVGSSTFSDRAFYVDLEGEPRRGPVLPAVTRGRGLRRTHITFRRCAVGMCGFGVAIVASGGSWNRLV